MRSSKLVSILWFILVGLVKSTCVFGQGHGWDDDFRDKTSQAAFAARDYGYCSMHGINELGLGNCLNSQSKFSENELNSTYQKIMNHLESNQKEALIKDERKWIKWRIKECDRQVKNVEDCVDGCGVSWTMNLVCVTTEANKRTDLLRKKWPQ